MKRHLVVIALVLAGLGSRPAACPGSGVAWCGTTVRRSSLARTSTSICAAACSSTGAGSIPTSTKTSFDVRTLRIGLKGNLTRHFDWEIEREIDEVADLEGGTRATWQFGQWKDVFVNWTTFDAFSVKGGRFKMPFGLEQNTGVSDLDFAYRALGSVKIAPGRDIGVMAYGELLERIADLRSGRVR